MPRSPVSWPPGLRWCSRPTWCSRAAPEADGEGTAIIAEQLC
ncbi:MAG: hypothetical protein R3E68_07970 [Burkholderiaceae bacterium]